MAITDATNPQAVTAATPAQDDASITPNSNDLDLSLDLPPVVRETTPDADRLKEEDKLVQAKIPEEVRQEAVIEENLPVSEKEFTLQDDMKIIQELQNPETTKIEQQAANLEMPAAEVVVETKAPETVVNVQPAIIPAPASNTMNLDSMLLDTPPVAPVTAVEQIKNPFDLIQTNTPVQQVAQPAVLTTATIATQATTTNKKK
jgi:hypothetical protein